jgi:hypothetical protein
MKLLLLLTRLPRHTDKILCKLSGRIFWTTDK